MSHLDDGGKRNLDVRAFERIASDFTARLPEKFHPDKYGKSLLNPWAKALMLATLQPFGNNSGFAVAARILKIFGIESSDGAVYNSVKAVIRDHGSDRIASLKQAIDRSAGDEAHVLIELAEEAVRALPHEVRSPKPKGGARSREQKPIDQKDPETALAAPISAEAQFVESPYWKIQPRAALIAACMLDAGAHARVIVRMLDQLYPTHNISEQVIENALETSNLRKSVSQKIKTDQKWEQKDETERAFIIERATDQVRDKS